MLALTLCILSSGCDSRSAPAYNNRGNAYRQQGEFENAIADLTKAIELDPLFAIAYNNRGFVFEKIGNKENAEADYAKAKELGFGQNKKSKR